MSRAERFKRLIAKEIAMIAAQEYEAGMMCCGHDYEGERVCRRAAEKYQEFLDVVEEIYDASGDNSRLSEAALAVPGADLNGKS